MFLQDFVQGLLKKAAKSGMTEIEFYEMELAAWLQSDKRRFMQTGQRYYEGHHDIELKERKAIGANGKEQPLHNLPNSRLTDNRYAELVDQKVGYLLSKPVDIKTENKSYADALKEVFNARFRRKLKLLGEDSLNAGIAYLYPYAAPDGSGIQFKRFAPEQVLPFWRDEEHEELDSFLRVYSTTVYEGRQRKEVLNVELYTLKGIRYFTWENDRLVPDVTKTDVDYLKRPDGKTYNWERIPLVAFRYNSRELSLLSRVKCLQDALNTLMSNFADNMLEDVRSTVLILENYEGEDLSTFRKNLATYGVIKVGSDDARRGDVRRLVIEVNSTNYEVIIKLLRRAIIENGHGFDAKDERMGNNPNQMNIQSIYCDIDIDADSMEMEFQSSLEQLLWFINTYLGFFGKQPAPVEFIFNRDTPINESEVIKNCAASEGVISKETIVANHPWVVSADEELTKLEKEEEKRAIEYVKPNGAEDE